LSGGRSAVAREFFFANALLAQFIRHIDRTPVADDAAVTAAV
jgi:hypothetical protein